MIVDPINKKGEKLNPANYRATALLSIPGKVVLYVLLQRIKNNTETRCKESQYGFRPIRGIVDAIYILDR